MTNNSKKTHMIHMDHEREAQVSSNIRRNENITKACLRQLPPEEE